MHNVTFFVQIKAAYRICTKIKPRKNKTNLMTKTKFSSKDHEEFVLRFIIGQMLSKAMRTKGTLLKAMP